MPHALTTASSPVTKIRQDSTRDYWERKKNNPKYRDAQGEYWKDQNLDDKWERWITAYMQQRLSNLQTEIDTKMRDVSSLNRAAQADRNLPATRKQRIDDRYRRLSRAWSATKPLRNPSPF